MKRYLNRDQYRLTDYERDRLWRGIVADAAPQAHRRSRLLPATGVVATLAFAALGILMINGGGRMGSGGRVPYHLSQQTWELEVQPRIAPEPARPMPQVEAAPDAMSAPELESTAPIELRGKPYRVEVKSALQERTLGDSHLQNYAIDSVEEAVSKQAGVQMRDGDLSVRSGRSGNITMRIDDEFTPLPGGRAEAPSAPSGSITGGTTPPNGEPYESMYFEHAGVNPFIATEEDRFSTFAVDVDEASWTITRNYLSRGHLPPPAAVRVEEFVNAFDPGFPPQVEDDFAIRIDGSRAPFREGYRLLRVAVQARTMPPEERRPAHLVFVIDVSGSMNRENRLGLVKRALRILVGELGEGDRVGIVAYGSRARTILEPTDASRREVILSAIDALRSGGSTNAAEGLDRAYDMVRHDLDPDAINRLILCSDGVANMAETAAEDILARVRRESDRGIYLSTVGFGMGNYNDVLMETLADKGDGNYAYVDRLDEADRIFRENLGATLQVVARDAKIQVEFEPDAVLRYRLLGFENRDVADRDFRNNRVDAGEIGAGHTVTALYELKLAPGLESPDDGPHAPALRDAHLATVRVRYEDPDGSGRGNVHEIERRAVLADVGPRFEETPAPYRLQAAAAEFAEILRHSYWAKEHRVAGLVPLARGLGEELYGDERALDFVEAVRWAAELEGGDSRVIGSDE